MTTIALCMIVKNEAHVIRRCLESALPLIDHALIVDTGSSDGTQQVIREFLQEQSLSGQIIEEPWRDFAYNRSFALQALRETLHIEYGLMIDADSVIEYGAGFDATKFKQDLRQDLYDVDVRLGGISYSLPLLFSNRVGFAYRGVLHEYLVVPPDCTRAAARGLSNRHRPDGARSRNPGKYQDDAALLENALLTEADPFLISRYTFYLAQSYKDSGENEKALQCYLRRAQLGFWKEEVFISLYRGGQIMEALGRTDAEIVQTYLEAYEACPTRVESLHGAIRYCRFHSKYQQGYIFGRHALALRRPETGLFLEEWIYSYGLLDEYAIVAYWAGYYRECFDACLRILGEKAIPESQRDRVRKNAEFALAKLDDPELAGRLYAVSGPSSATAFDAPSYARISYQGCPLCDAAEAIERKVGDCSGHPLYKPELPRSQRWLECRACGHVYVDGYFGPEAVAVLFSATNAGQVPGYEVENQRYLWSRVVEKVRGMDENGAGRWLDVGFGNGSLMTTAAEFGYRTVGIDLRTESVRLMNEYGFEAHAVDLDAYRCDEAFDVVSMTDVLERVPFPKRSLRRVRELLRPGGMLFVSMPNADAFVWQFLTRNDANPYWGEIEHYHNFGRARLEALLEECDFEPVHYGVSTRYRACMEVIARTKNRSP